MAVAGFRSGSRYRTRLTVRLAARHALEAPGKTGGFSFWCLFRRFAEGEFAESVDEVFSKSHATVVEEIGQ